MKASMSWRGYHRASTHIAGNHDWQQNMWLVRRNMPLPDDFTPKLPEVIKEHFRQDVKAAIGQKMKLRDSTGGEYSIRPQAEVEYLAGSRCWKISVDLLVACRRQESTLLCHS